MPNLRFPEFHEEWQEYTLSDKCQINPRSTNLPNTFVYIDLESVVNGILLKEEKIFKSDSPSRAQRLLKQNDILFQMVRPYQKNNLFFDKKGNYVASTGYAQIRTEENPQFIFQYLHNQNFVNNVIEKCTGTSYPSINSTDLSNIHLHIPTIKEQQKIADFLSLIDARSQLSKKIIEGLTSFKSAVSKKIFSQELRFSSLDIKWEKVKLKEVCEKQSSNISANKIEDNFGDYLIYGASGKLKTVDFYEVEDDYISVVKDGAGVGRLLYCKGKSSVLGTLDIIKPKNGINPYFLYCLLLNIDFGKYITGSTIPHIYFKDYSNEIIEMPLIEEQIIIANFLSCIDQKVNLEIALLQQLKSQKQYLLQQLFI